MLASSNQILSELRTRLEQSRSRVRAGLLLRAALWSALVAGVSFLLLRLLAFLGQPLGVLWSAVIFAVAFMVGIFWAWQKTPSLLELAQRADRRFALFERTSTALELSQSQHEGLSGNLASAVLADAARYSSQIIPRVLAPMKFPRVGWLTLSLALVIAVVQFVVPERFFTQQETVVISEPLSAEEQNVTVTNLRRTAELLSEEAEVKKDPYLQALAQAFNELSTKIETGSLDREATQLELNRLMEHVERAFAGEGEATPSSEGFSNTPNPELTSQPLPPDAIENQLPSEGQTAAMPGASQQTSPSSSLDELLSGLGRIEATLQQNKANREANQGQVTMADRQQFGPYITPESLEGLKALEERRKQQALAAGQPVGAAQESTAGEGDLAGEGSQALSEGEMTDFETLGEVAEEMLLPENQTASGERIQLELPLPTQLTEVADRQEANTEEWQAGQETELRRDFIGPQDRAVVSRYFNREETATSEQP